MKFYSDEQKSKLKELILLAKSQGKTHNEIASEFNAQGNKTARGLPWTDVAVSMFVRNNIKPVNHNTPVVKPKFGDTAMVILKDAKLSDTKKIKLLITYLEA